MNEKKYTNRVTLTGVVTELISNISETTTITARATMLTNKEHIHNKDENNQHVQIVLLGDTGDDFVKEITPNDYVYIEGSIYIQVWQDWHGNEHKSTVIAVTHFQKLNNKNPSFQAESELEHDAS